jgi:hypothetical protein
MTYDQVAAALAEGKGRRGVAVGSEAEVRRLRRDWREAL